MDCFSYLSNVVTNSILLGVMSLGHKWQFDYASQIDTGDAQKNDRLIAICKHYNARTIVLGLGSKDYVEAEIEKYKDNGIAIEYQDWTCPVENYSLLHAVAMYGWDEVRKILGIE